MSSWPQGQEICTHEGLDSWRSIGLLVKPTWRWLKWWCLFLRPYQQNPVSHTPNPQPTVYGSEFLSFGLGMSGVCSKRYVGFPLDCCCYIFHIDLDGCFLDEVERSRNVIMWKYIAPFMLKHRFMMFSLHSSPSRPYEGTKNLRALYWLLRGALELTNRTNDRQKKRKANKTSPNNTRHDILVFQFHGFLKKWR